MLFPYTKSSRNKGLNNPNELEKLILALYEDPKKADSLVSNALKSVEKYSVENMSEAYIKIYEE